MWHNAQVQTDAIKKNKSVFFVLFSLVFLLVQVESYVCYNFKVHIF